MNLKLLMNPNMQKAASVHKTLLATAKSLCSSNEAKGAKEEFPRIEPQSILCSCLQIFPLSSALILAPILVFLCGALRALVPQ